MLGFSFPLKLMLCWCFQRSEHLAGGVAANLGELPFVTSERADFHVFKHKLFEVAQADKVKDVFFSRCKSWRLGGF